MHCLTDVRDCLQSEVANLALLKDKMQRRANTGSLPTHDKNRLGAAIRGAASRVTSKVSADNDVCKLVIRIRAEMPSAQRDAGAPPVPVNIDHALANKIPWTDSVLSELPSGRRVTRAIMRPVVDVGNKVCLCGQLLATYHGTCYVYVYVYVSKFNSECPVCLPGVNWATGHKLRIFVNPCVHASMRQ